MSIRDVISDLVANGRLSNLGLVIPGDAVVRTMFLSAEIKALLDGPWQDRAAENRFGRLRANLESFIKGETVGLCMDPFEAGAAYMGRLNQPRDGIWDIRSRDPKPALRVFGGFSERDTFVALTCAIRKRLGDRHSREWRDELEGCKAEWRRMFHPYEPITGEDIHDFISENVFLI